MPVETVAVISGVVAAFVLFGLALAYAEISTRNLHRH